MRRKFKKINHRKGPQNSSKSLQSNPVFWSQLCFKINVVKKKQRTNGPVNAHLRSAVYTNVIENSPSIGVDEALGPFFFKNNQYTRYGRKVRRHFSYQKK